MICLVNNQINKKTLEICKVISFPEIPIFHKPSDFKDHPSGFQTHHSEIKDFHFNFLNKIHHSQASKMINLLDKYCNNL